MDVVVAQYLNLLPSWAIAIILVIGSLRIVLKPAMELFKAVVLVTPTTKDDALPSKVESSAVWKALVFVVDYVASIKLPKK